MHVCTIDNVQLDGADVSMDANTVWSDSNGKAVVYFQPASTVAFSIKAVTFTSSEEATDSITAKEQNYTYEDGNLKKGKECDGVYCKGRSRPPRQHMVKTGKCRYYHCQCGKRLYTRGFLERIMMKQWILLWN